MPRQAGVLNDALGAIGHTPLIRLDRIAKDAGLKCNLCEPSRIMVSDILLILSSGSGESRIHVFWWIRKG